MENMTDLYLNLRDPIYRYLYYLSGNADQAEDLTQETFFQALIALARFRSESSIKTWLFSIARNTYLNSLKKANRLHRQQLNESVHSILPVDGLNDPLDYILKMEQKRSLAELIGQLPENMKTVLVLKEYEGWEYKELAFFLGKTENWARVTYYRAKQQLRLLYHQDDVNS